MSEVLEVLKTRRSIRGFLPEMVPQADLDQIIEAGLYAASGMNRQESIIIQVTNQDLRNEIAKRNAEIMGKPDMDPFYGAPVILIVLDRADCPTKVYDGSLVLGNMMAQAHAIGLGSCWIHRAKEEFESDWGKNLLELLGVEGSYEGIGHLALGYPAGNAPESKERVGGRVFYVR